MNDVIIDLFEWIKNDYRSWPLRFCVEVTAWLISIGCALTMSLTVPDAPLKILYPFWIAGCALFTWAAYTRKSFGIIANYMLLVTIDTIGLVRLYTN